MKKIVLLIVFVLYYGHSLSQEQINLESAEVKQRIFDPAFFPKVKGKLLNYHPEKDQALVVEYSVVVPSSLGSETRTATINPKGEFRINFENGLPYQQIWLNVGDYYYGEILANQELEIILDLAKLKAQFVEYVGEGVEFIGADAEANQLVNEYHQYAAEEKVEFTIAKGKLMENRQLSLEEKVQSLRELFQKLEQIEQTFSQNHPSEYAWILENKRQSWMYSEIFVIHFLHGKKEIDPDLLSECLDHTPTLLSNEGVHYYNYLSRMLQSITFAEEKNIIERILGEEEQEGNQNPKLYKVLEAYQKRLSGEKYNQKIFEKDLKQHLRKYPQQLLDYQLDLYLEKAKQLPKSTANLVKLMGRPMDVWERERYVKKVLPTLTSPWCQQLMQQDLTSSQERIAKTHEILAQASQTERNPHYGIYQMTLGNDKKLYLADHKNIKDLLNALRVANPEKAMILDIWTTWCAPCLEDFKDSKNVKEEIKKLPVEMIYVCAEDKVSVDQWKKKVAELEIPGTHIFLNHQLNQELFKHFKLSGYPSYIFMDRAGNFDPTFIELIAEIDLEALKKKL